jgi:hypothetical protein
MVRGVDAMPDNVHLGHRLEVLSHYHSDRPFVYQHSHALHTETGAQFQSSLTMRNHDGHHIIAELLRRSLHRGFSKG